MLSVSSNKLSSSKEITTSRITKLLLVKLTTMTQTLTWTNSMVLAGSQVLTLRRGEEERHRRVGAIAAIEPKRLSGGVAPMVRERCATLVVYVCVYLVYLNCRLLRVFRLRKIDPQNGSQGLCFNWLNKSATKGVEPSLSMNGLLLLSHCKHRSASTCH